MHHFQKLKEFLSNINKEGISIKTQQGDFTAQPVFSGESLIGVNVNNLGNDSFLPIEAFAVTISLLSLSNEGRADKGNAMNCRLGDEKLAFNSIEGHVASVIYGKTRGESVFRRITPIAKILEAAGVCENGKGFLRLIH